MPKTKPAEVPVSISVRIPLNLYTWLRSMRDDHGLIIGSIIRDAIQAAKEKAEA